MPDQLEQHLANAQANNDREGAAFYQLVLGVLASQTNDAARGLIFLGDSLAFYHEVNDRFFMSAILNWMGHLKLRLSDALPLFQQGLEISREAGQSM